MSQGSIATRPLVARAGNYVIQCSELRPGIWRVETLTAGAVAQPVEELTHSFSDEHLARAIARVVTVALRKPDATVDDARRAVVQHLDGQLVMLLAEDDIANTIAGAALQAVKALFESPADTVWTDGLAADMVAFHRSLAATVGNPGNFDNGGYPPCAADAQDMSEIPAAVVAS